MINSYKCELTKEDLEVIAEDFLGFVDEKYRGMEPDLQKDYPFNLVMEEFAQDYPLSTVGKGFWRAVFESDREMPGEKEAVVKFPRQPVGKTSQSDGQVNLREAATWKMVSEAGMDNPEWYAEVYEAALDGSFLVQEKVDKPSILELTLQNPAIMYTYARARFSMKADKPVEDMKTANIGARGYQPVFVDYPWINEDFLETLGSDDTRFLTELGDSKISRDYSESGVEELLEGLSAGAEI